MSWFRRFLSWATPTPPTAGPPRSPEPDGRDRLRNRMLAELWLQALQRRAAWLESAVGDLRVELELHELAF